MRLCLAEFKNASVGSRRVRVQGRSQAHTSSRLLAVIVTPRDNTERKLSFFVIDSTFLGGNHRAH